MKIQHHLIIKEARKRGLKVTDVSTTVGSLATTIESGSKSELFVNGTPLSLINLRSLQYFDNKQLTKSALSKLNIPHPKSILFSSPDDSKISNFLENGKSYVCKPLDLGEGTGVEMNIKSSDEVSEYWNRNKNISTNFILEEQVEGDDLRVQVIAGKIVAVCTREPAFVIGDGVSDLNKLIENRRKIVQAANPMNDLTVDKATLKLLRHQNISLIDVPEKGKKIRLKEIANMSQGAVAIDITDELHPIFQEWIDRIVNFLNVDYFAIDFISSDFQNTPENQSIVLEINAKPEWLHHTFSEGRQHDIAGMILDALFGEGSAL
jgi:cyanophycin synthetase